MDGLLKESLEALKDIVNAADNGYPYSPQELANMVLPILGRAYEVGVRLNGEEEW